MHKHVFSIGLVILLLAMGGCGTDPEVQLAELSRNTVVYEEIVRLNNCGGKGDSDHTATREFATTIEFGAGISAGYKSIVEGNIAAKYSEYRKTSKSLRVVAPPGTSMEFLLRWSDDVRAGNVQVDGRSGTYEVRIPVAIEQISSRDLGCGISSSSTTSTPEAVPTAINQPQPPAPQQVVPPATSTSQTAKSEHSTVSPSIPVQPSPIPTQRGTPTQPIIISTAMQVAGPFREHRKTPIVGSGLLAQGTYSDGLAPFSESEIAQHLNIQRIRLEEYADGCGVAFLDADKIWLGSSVRTKLTINDRAVGDIFGPTGKHGYVFDVTVRKGDKICVTYFESSGFHIVFGPDMYYHYDSYCYRGQCN